MDELMEYSLKVLQEASTVEQFRLTTKLNKDGFPDPDTRLASVISFEGGYVASDPVLGNGFAHYYIIAGMIEAFTQKYICNIYGGRTRVDILKIEEDRQIVDLGVYMIFDSKTPYVDPKTGQWRSFE